MVLSGLLSREGREVTRESRFEVLRGVVRISGLER
jgi:hypothetical protein